MDTLFLVFSLDVDKRKKASFQTAPYLSNALFFYQRMHVCLWNCLYCSSGVNMKKEIIIIKFCILCKVGFNTANHWQAC